jgi:hypothetical protein
MNVQRDDDDDDDLTMEQMEENAIKALQNDSAMELGLATLFDQQLALLEKLALFSPPPDTIN